MLLEPAVATHLEKYFVLARGRFIDGDRALAAFFAITAIEESAKVMILKGTFAVDTSDVERRRRSLEHGEKLSGAVINLLEQNPRFETWPREWQDEVASWFDTTKLIRIKNDGIYLRFTKSGHVSTPEERIDVDQAALLVYMAGVAVAELNDYIEGLAPGWAGSILQAAEAFRAQFLKK